MTKLIILVAAVVVIVWLLRRTMTGSRSRAGKPPEPASPQGELVECAQCGVKLPRAEARTAGGRFYCSEEHWRLGPRDG